MVEDDDRSSTGLRGRLAGVYFTALLEGAQEALATRLGERATTYNPLFGAASGLDAIAAHLEALAGWLREKQARYRPTFEIIGIDRDVTEGVLTIQHDGQPEPRSRWSCSGERTERSISAPTTRPSP